jgi:hypothetical protein
MDKRIGVGEDVREHGVGLANEQDRAALLVQISIRPVISKTYLRLPLPGLRIIGL